MLKLFLSPRATEDLEEIYEYTFRTWGFSQAEKYQDLLFESMYTILKTPKIGSKYYFKKGNYRKLHSNKHIMFYKIQVEKCIVVRILHEKMDFESHSL
jgi:toxin ParE1/3/4